MPIRMTGMNSGLDTESIISQLVSAKSTKKNSMVKAQTKLSWKMDAWKTLNNKIYGLYTNTLSDMRFSATYAKKKTTVSNSNIASVLADPSAVDGVQTLKVKELAKTGYLTGAELKDENNKKASYTANTKLSDIAGLDLNEDEGTSMTLKVGGKETTISLTKDSTINDFVSQLKSAGVNASFDAKNQRIFISAADTGKDSDFSLTANNANGFNALTAMGVNVLDAATKASYETLRDMTEEEKTAYINQKVADREAAAQKAIENANKSIEKNTETLGKQQEKFDNYFSKIEDLFFVKSEMDTTEKLDAVKEQLSQQIESRKNAPEGETEAEKAAREAELKQAEERLKTTDELLAYSKSIDAINTAISDAEKTVSDNEDLLAYDSAEIIRQETEALDSRIAMANSALGSSNYSAATRIEGMDAEIVLNGATFTNSSNTFNINGLTITAQAKSDEEVTLTTANDYDGVYDTIKNFLKGYNELINEMDKLYGADSSKGYEPLTSEEKEAMTDKEVEEWEKKIKDSLLRRDSTLGGIKEAMQSAMSAGYSIGGTTYYLSSFGINTLGYFDAADNEKHAYHIDGDKDDTATSGKDDILKNMIANDPKTVTEFFQKLTNGLYETLTKKMSSSSMSSIYKVYNDKQMKSDYDSYTKKIAEEEKKVNAYEDKWYRKFGAMETALAKLNSKTSALSGLIGGGR